MEKSKLAYDLFLTILILVLMISTSNVVSAQSTPEANCELYYQQYQSTGSEDFLRAWSHCVQRKCRPSNNRCSAYNDCQRYCTEAATTWGGIISCCLGGPKRTNSCTDLVDGRCNPERLRIEPGYMPELHGSADQGLYPLGENMTRAQTDEITRAYRDADPSGPPASLGRGVPMRSLLEVFEITIPCDPSCGDDDNRAPPSHGADIPMSSLWGGNTGQAHHDFVPPGDYSAPLARLADGSYLSPAAHTFAPADTFGAPTLQVNAFTDGVLQRVWNSISALFAGWFH